MVWYAGAHSVIPPFLRGGSTLPKVIKTGIGNFTDKKGGYLKEGINYKRGGSIISMIKIFHKIFYDIGCLE